MNKIKIMIKEPGQEPVIKEVDDNLKTFQEIVGGYIECVEMPGINNVDLYVNEEGKLDKLPGNFWLPEYEDCVCGTCYFVGFDPETGDNVDISNKAVEFCKKYAKFFELPKGLDLYQDFYVLEAIMKHKYKEYKKLVAEMWYGKQNVN